LIENGDVTHNFESGPTSNVEKNVYIWEMTCKVMGLNCPDPTFVLRQSRSIITMRDFNDIY
jgi:hypothetical protein